MFTIIFGIDGPKGILLSCSTTTKILEISYVKANLH